MQDNRKLPADLRSLAASEDVSTCRKADCVALARPLRVIVAPLPQSADYDALQIVGRVLESRSWCQKTGQVFDLRDPDASLSWCAGWSCHCQRLHTLSDRQSGTAHAALAGVPVDRCAVEIERQLSRP